MAETGLGAGGDVGGDCVEERFRGGGRVVGVVGGDEFTAVDEDIVVA